MRFRNYAVKKFVMLLAVLFVSLPFLAIAEGVEDMRVVATIYESARTGRTIEINSKLNKTKVLLNEVGK